MVLIGEAPKKENQPAPGALLKDTDGTVIFAVMVGDAYDLYLPTGVLRPGKETDDLLKSQTLIYDSSRSQYIVKGSVVGDSSGINFMLAGQNVGNVSYNDLLGRNVSLYDINSDGTIHETMLVADPDRLRHELAYLANDPALEHAMDLRRGVWKPS